MADVIQLHDQKRERRESGAATCAMLYASLKFDPSNVVFAPAFCTKARDAYDNRNLPVKEAS